MKTTPFTEKHIALGAKMHEFAGYNMPIEYSGIIDEHLTVCNGVGVFDVSHMGEFWVKGPHALDFLQKVTSNNVAALVPGKIQYTCFPNEDGGIVDDLLVYQYEPEKYLLVVNASNIEKDWNWCISHNTEGAELENSSDNMAQLAVQGPKAIQALQKLTDINLADIPYYTFKVGEFAGENLLEVGNREVFHRIFRIYNDRHGIDRDFFRFGKMLFVAEKFNLIFGEFMAYNGHAGFPEEQGVNAGFFVGVVGED